MVNLELIKNYLNKESIDAWVIYDYECKNDALISLIGKKFLTRKVFMSIPRRGNPFVICHNIDSIQFKNLVGFDLDIYLYKTWNEMIDLLNKHFKDYDRVCMEISDDGSLPKMSYCDYGTICLIEKIGCKVLSSANLLMMFNAPFIGKSYQMHLDAMDCIVKIKDEAFSLIEKTIKDGQIITEYDVMMFINQRFEEENLITDSDPIVAINGNASNPHYQPTQEINQEIKKGDLVLIDLWARYNDENAVYADITWMGYVGKEVPKIIDEVFQIVKESIDKVLDFLNNELPSRKVYGYEVDQFVRDIITSYGYGDYFIHRTGHSISIDDNPHGKGVNIDNYETHDSRELINNICFSIEPGIYLEKFGIREEINVYINDNKAISTAPRQQKIITMDI